MNKQDFIKYTANRYGIEENVAETIIDMFSTSLHELVIAGQSVTIDEIGEFQTTPLFPKPFNPKGNFALEKLLSKNMVIFKPSEKLTTEIA